MDKWLYRLSVVAVSLKKLVSIYMTIYKITNDNRMCLGSGDCGTVNQSIYAEVNGFPVAGIGIIGYAAILTVLLMETRGSFFRENGTLMIFGMALVGFLFTVWLIYVELVLIKAICPFCVTSQVAMTIIFIMAVIRLIRQPQI